MIVEQLAEIIRNTLHTTEHIQKRGWVTFYNASDLDGLKNQFAIFLKPEATYLQGGVRFQELLDYLLETFKTWKVDIGAVRILSSEYLGRHQVMDAHYGVINRISKHGLYAISAKANDVLKSDLADDLAAGAEVLGGHQFLARFPRMSAFGLSLLSDNLGVKKLSGGTYSSRIEVGGNIFLVLNAFHPFQLEHFTTGDRTIVVMEGQSNTPWNELRREMVGATNPAFAFQGSIRNTLYNRGEEFGLPNVSQSSNGIHLSAGPLEGMVELQRFFSDLDENDSLEFDKTCFGNLLLSCGMSDETLIEIATNPDTDEDGRLVSVFDLTEEMDAEPAVEKLLNASESIVVAKDNK